MKRSIACALAVMTMASVPMAVYADNVTVLTTTVPDATYTLNIPADQEIAFGTTLKILGSVTVTESAGFTKGKNLHVSIEHNDFVAENVSTTIHYGLFGSYRTGSTGAEPCLALTDGLTFYGESSGGTVEQYARTAKTNGYKIDDIVFSTNSSYWGRALGGDYHSEITFTAEVVVE